MVPPAHHAPAIWVVGLGVGRASQSIAPDHPGHATGLTTPAEPFSTRENYEMAGRAASAAAATGWQQLRQRVGAAFNASAMAK
jgi:hypothetical protein